MAASGRNRPQSIHGWVAEELGTRIVSGTYAPGEYIPNEATIGEELNVSRTALREAFKILTAKGLIEARPKLGTRVRPRQYWNMFDTEILSWCFESKPTPQFFISLFEVREIFEPAAAELAAKNRSAEQVKNLAKAYKDMEKAELGTDKVFSSDLNFHLSVLNATNNEFMISLGMTIQTALMGLFRLSSSIGDEYKESLPGHKAVYEAIAAADPAAAKQEMSKLLHKSKENLEYALEHFTGNGA
ncbi:FadR/GntR family transcriptional regulator [Chromatiaceae bacterium AAb-1]|nr:FadR/GntR family transcriptional regulator [Chromatiaceae bacterium AAb-1]